MRITNRVLNRQARKDKQDLIVNKDDAKSEATIYLYDEIWIYGVNANDFVKEVDTLNVDTINLRIHSPGGDTHAARAMQMALKRNKATVNAYIDGWAVSAATTVAFGADYIEMSKGGLFMIHNPLMYLDLFGIYNSTDLQSIVDEITKDIGLLDKITISIAEDYVNKTGIEYDEVREMMNNETWMNAEEALNFGFIDKITEGGEGGIENKFVNKFDESILNLYKNRPDTVDVKNEADRSLSNEDIENLRKRAELELSYLAT